MHRRSKDIPAQIGTIYLHGTEREQQGKEPAVIASSETVVDPRTVMIAFGHAMSAKAAVLRSCWFVQIAGAAHVARPKEDVAMQTVQTLIYEVT